MQIFRCVVEDNQDPEHLGRVKIRVFGVHNPKIKYVSMDDLPWSEVLHYHDASNSFGTSTNIRCGTHGYAIALNETYTEFLFIGAMKGKFIEPPSEFDDDGDEMGFRDLRNKSGDDLYLPKRIEIGDNPLTYGEEPEGKYDESIEVSEGVPDSNSGVGTFSEKKYKSKDDTTKNASYPYNKVYEDTEGNSVQIDGTPGNARIKIRHASGARIHINKDGEIEFHSETGNIWMDAPGMVSFKGDGGVLIEGDLKINGSVSVEGKLSTKGNITSRSKIADATGSLDNLRDIYNTHTHPETSPTTDIDNGNSVPDFNWSGSPK